MATRAGVKRVRRTAGGVAGAGDAEDAAQPWWTVDMGTWRLLEPDLAAASGADARVAVAVRHQQGRRDC